MICYRIDAAIVSALFEYDGSFHMLRMTETQDFNEFDGQSFEVLEVRKDTDGTPMPQYGLTEALGALVAESEMAPVIREALNQGGARIAEATFVSQFGTYHGFRAFNLYEDTPQAPVFRTRTTPSNPDLWMDQLYTPQFAEWLQANFDTRGLSINRVERDPYFYRPDPK